MEKWTFVRMADGSDKKGTWMLKLQSASEIERFVKENSYFAEDRTHFHRIIDQGLARDDHTAVTHTNLGWFAKSLVKGTIPNKNSEQPIKDIDSAYDYISNLQKDTMLKVLKATGCVYVNRKMGFHGERNQKHIAFCFKKNLDFPSYCSNDIVVKRFPDGVHYYAYIGETQVRDGDIVKWDTYEEAYKQAEKLKT